MLQYLLNATAIWLISLALFDLLLARERFHAYNRGYLLFTLLLGGLLPLWQFGGANDPVYGTDVGYSLERFTTAKTRITNVALASNQSLSWQHWVMWLYVAGAVVALVLLIADCVRLLVFYRNGTKHEQGRWTIVQTGSSHAPFSFRHILFITGIERYTSEELQIILAHEGRHASLLHVADVVLLQLLRVVGWFHPMVYLYNSRLLMVHEYQADSVVTNPQHYARFLVEQALLQSAPVITHSFNCSPIKKRIVMLTHQSSAAARIKMAVLLPLIPVFIACFSQSSFSQKFERKGNLVTYRGNTFEMYAEPNADTIILTDPVTGGEILKVVKKDPQPVKLNGAKIYSGDELTTPPQPYAANGKLEDYLLRNLDKELSVLADGTYRVQLGNVVTDKSGEVVFYEFYGITQDGTNKGVDPELKKMIATKIDIILTQAPAMQPAKVNNNSVPAKANVSMYRYRVVVKDHKVTIE